MAQLARVVLGRVFSGRVLARRVASIQAGVAIDRATGDVSRVFDVWKLGFA